MAECIAHESDTENEYMAKELGESIRLFVRTLPERDGNIFIRRYFFTEPVSVIANRNQMSANNVMVILSRTRKKLKAHLEKEGLYE